MMRYYQGESGHPTGAERFSPIPTRGPELIRHHSSVTIEGSFQRGSGEDDHHGTKAQKPSITAAGVHRSNFVSL
jgi:hypothetical protein